MRIVMKEIHFKVSNEIKQGDILELENMVNHSKEIVKIIKINSDNVKIIELRDGNIKTYTYKELSKHEARKMKLVYDENTSILSQAVQSEFQNEPTKEECERAAEAYRSNMELILKELQGCGLNVVRM